MGEYSVFSISFHDTCLFMSCQNQINSNRARKIYVMAFMQCSAKPALPPKKKEWFELQLNIYKIWVHCICLCIWVHYICLCISYFCYQHSIGETRHTCHLTLWQPKAADPGYGECSLWLAQIVWKINIRKICQNYNHVMSHVSCITPYCHRKKSFDK